MKKMKGVICNQAGAVELVIGVFVWLNIIFAAYALAPEDVDTTIKANTTQEQSVE